MCVCVFVSVSVCAECGGLCACEACGVETCVHKAHIDGTSCVCVFLCVPVCVCVCFCVYLCVWACGCVNNNKFSGKRDVCISV